MQEEILGSVQVAGDANLIPANIKSGVSIFGVDGTMQGVEMATITLSIGRAHTDVDYFQDGQSKTVTVSRDEPQTIVVPVGSLIRVHSYALYNDIPGVIVEIPSWQYRDDTYSYSYVYLVEKGVSIDFQIIV